MLECQVPDLNTRLGPAHPDLPLGIPCLITWAEPSWPGRRTFKNVYLAIWLQETRSTGSHWLGLSQTGGDTVQAATTALLLKLYHMWS